jgi:putative transposase
MGRPKRLIQDCGTYHLIARGNNRHQVFEISGGYAKFKEILLLSLLKFDWKIHHYCLMPNHLHLLANIEIGAQLPFIMKYILQCYSRWYRDHTGYVGYLWQGRYKSPLIDKESYLLECGRYIERNPVRAKIVSKAVDYEWSSYNYYAAGRNDALVNPNPLYQDFGTSAFDRQQRYKEFVRLSSPYEPLLEQAILSNRF